MTLPAANTSEHELSDLEIRSYDELIAALRMRRHELGLSQMDLDHLAGFQDGYSGKLQGRAAVIALRAHALPGERKSVGGRPTKFEASFPDRCIEIMGRGFSLTAVAADLGVARATINNWFAAHPVFKEAAAIGQAMRTLHLERALLAGENGPQVNAYIFALKNAAPEDWGDRHQIDVPCSIALEIAEPC